MEEQLNTIDSTSPRLGSQSPTGVRFSLGLLLKRYGVSAVVAVLIVATPVVYATFAASSYVITDPSDYFLFSLGNALPLFFTLFSALLYVPVVLQETRSLGWLPIVARRGRVRYVLTHVTRSASFGAVAFGASISIAALWAYAVVPRSGWVTYSPGDRMLPFTQQMTFSQLAQPGVWVFVLFLVVWVGFHGALYSVLFTALAMQVRNPFLAILAGPAVLFLLGTALAIARLEVFMPDNAVLPTGLIQGPIIQPMLTTGVLTLVVLTVVVHTAWSARTPRALQ